MKGLFLAVIGGPLLAGVALLASRAMLVVSRWWAGSPRRDKALGALPLVVAACTALGLAALLPWAGSDMALSVQWLPGAGQMVIGLGATGLYVALATTGACAVALWGTRASQSYWMDALTLLSIAAAQIAFLAEHFLARYVALEIVALCVALAPLVELRPTDDSSSERGSNDGAQAGGRLARMVYLVLRLGDVGLLVAILVLWSATGTLDIAPALEAGKTLAAMPLNWVVAGLVLAVWVKIGGWPVHLWQQAGERLSLVSHSWLYATLMPNLGLYLLYRVTPLLTQAKDVQGAAYWIGAVGAALAAILALVSMRLGLRSSLVYLGAALGGLALVWAASGLKSVVWMTALVLTPLRLLFYFSSAAPPTRDEVSVSLPAARASVVGFHALGGLALSGTCLLCAWWARQAGTPPAVLLVAEFAAAAICIWAARSTWLLWRPPVASEPVAQIASIPWGANRSGHRDAPPTAAIMDAPPIAANSDALRYCSSGIPMPGGRLLQTTNAPGAPDVKAAQRLSGRRISALALLGSITLAGMLFLGPLTDHLAHVAHGEPLHLPAVSDVAHYLATTPGFWIALVLVVAGRQFFLRRPGALARARASAALGDETSGRQALHLEEGLAQAAQI